MTNIRLTSSILEKVKKTSIIMLQGQRFWLVFILGVVILSVGFLSIKQAGAEADGLGLSLDGNNSYSDRLNAMIGNTGYTGSLPVNADLGVYHCKGSQGGYCGGDSGDFDRAVNRSVFLDFPTVGSPDKSVTLSGLPSAGDFGNCGRVQVDVGKEGMGVFGGKTFSIGENCPGDSNPPETQVPVCNGNEVSLSVSPNPANVGQSMVFTANNASTFFGDSVSGGVGGNCTSNGANMTCSATQPGTFTWTHTWKRCEGNFNNCSSQCSKSVNFTVNQRPPVTGFCYICDRGDWRPVSNDYNKRMTSDDCQKEQNSLFGLSGAPAKPGWCSIQNQTDVPVYAPAVDIKANNSDGPITIGHNAAATLSWSSNNANSCSASNAWSGGRNTSGSESTGNLTSSRTFTITCTGTGGSAADSVAVNVDNAPNAPTVDIKANNSDGPITIGHNTAATLSWSSSNANSCSASNAWSGGRNTSGSESTGNLTSSRTFTITCTGTGGSVADSVAVNVDNAPNAPTVDIKANGSDGSIAIGYNNSATLSWTSSNANSCSASNGWSGSRNTSGSESTGNLASSRTYTITCTGSGGSASDSVTINVDAPLTPSVDLKANSSDGPITLNYNSNANLSWNSNNAVSCEASGDWSGYKATYGSQSIRLSQLRTHTFSLVCKDSTDTRTASDSVTVNVTPNLPVVVTKPAIVTY